MRRDVRMGFAVGGVLLAVIIVAFLAIHRNHNKAVAFDKGTGDADVTSVDVNASAGEVNKPVPPPTRDAIQDSTAAKMAVEKPAEPKPTEVEKADADRWDALFASTGPNPAQGQLARDSASGSPASSKKSGKLADKPMKFMEAPSSPRDVQPSEPAPTSDNASHPASAPTGARTHIVHANETLSGISKLVYGSSKHYKAIEAANPGLDPTKLRPGMVLKIPPLEQARQVVKQQSADATSAADGKTYTVQQNDNLYKITRKLYGNGDKQEALYELNKATIGPDSTKLKPGMVLKLPAAPAAQ
jgi:nucleoid-associated protein YgaU